MTLPQNLDGAHLQELATADDELITKTIDWLRSHKPSSSALEALPSIVDFFCNSPLCEVADEIDLTRDRSPIPDRIQL
jgi:hypothetical protein